MFQLEGEFLKPAGIMNRTRYRQVLEDKLNFFMNQHGTTHSFMMGPVPQVKVGEGLVFWEAQH